MSFWGPNGLFLGLWKGLNTVLGSTHVVEELSFFMFSSIVTLDLDLVLGLLLTYVSLCIQTTFIFYGSLNSELEMT